MDLQALNAELTRITIFWLAMSAIAYAASMWCLYLVVKSAIRDGINESRLGDRLNTWTRSVNSAPKTTHLDDVRID